ncbi:hypothetical protein GCM10009775_16910 [Microbacterium aoyamense]|uniref:Ig-like domain-containing protein n=1 Tax=Microbacterium aoyamense TaxID=344166 RepID=A0ABN2PLX6_9MICO|nr:Ig-like domain-containing protein [Microbacterium aoyamense]
MVAGIAGAAIVAPAVLLSTPAFAAEPDTTKPVITAITPGDGSVVRGTAKFTASIDEAAMSYSYLEFNVGGRWLTDDTKEPGSVKYGNSPSITLDTTRWADGLYGLKVNAVDKSGNGAEKRVAVTIDNTAPAITTNLVDGQFVSGKGDIVVTVADANPLAYHAQLYKADGTQVPAVKGYSYAPSGTTLTIPATDWNALADGSYYLAVSARDKADNAASLKVALVRDSTRPEITVVSPGADAFVGRSAVVEFTATDASGFDVVAANLYRGSTLLRTLVRAEAPAGTEWSGTGTLPADLADGAYSIRFGATDKAKNNRTVTRSITVDATAPVVKIAAPAARDAVRGNLTVSGTATDTGAGIDEVVLHVRKVKDNGNLDGFLNTVTVPVVDGAWSVTLPSTGFADGAYGVTVLATDRVGNTNGGGASVKPFTIDNTRPGLAIVAPTSGSSVVAGASVDVVLSASDAGSLNRVAANLYDSAGELVKAIGATSGTSAIGATTWEGTYSFPAGIEPGAYTIRASASDVTGNTRTVTSSVLVTAPVVEPPVVEPPVVQPPVVEPPTKPTFASVLEWLRYLLSLLLGVFAR